MRAGYLQILEMQGLSFQHQAATIQVQRRMFQEFLKHYPTHYKSIQAYHAPLVAHVVFGMTKPFMSQNMRDRMQIGLRMDEETASQYERLSDLFASVGPHVIVRNARELLRERYHNERTFSLDKATAVIMS